MLVIFSVLILPKNEPYVHIPKISAELLNVPNDRLI